MVHYCLSLLMLLKVFSSSAVRSQETSNGTTAPFFHCAVVHCCVFYMDP